MRIAAIAIVSSSLFAGAASPAGEPSRFEPSAIEYFEKNVRPLLVENCYNCHSANTNSKGGLRVDDRNGLLTGGEHGAAIAPGKPDESLLIQAVSHTHDELKMPPMKQLAAEQIAVLRDWIEQGAAWPEAELPEDLGQPSPEYDAKRKEHWSWQPVRSQTLPTIRDAAWPRHEVDHFLLAALEQQGLRPVTDADKQTLIRRVTFDLTGLPPTPAEIEAFLADAAPDALARVVDRLLASPAYGERWGRHWLDVARFGESTGSSRNLPYPHAWRYRDYVIAAFNADKPYDAFIREQIAGDLLPADTDEKRDEQRIATGFLALGVKDVNQRFKVRFVMDNIDEQIDTVSRAFLGLTASCARCHDHKFDPIPAHDYYALAGIFSSTDLCAGVRNKMGGGGLDYYDTSMLIRVGKDRATEVDPEVVKQAEELKVKVEAARQEFVALRGKPEGNEPSPDGRPKRQVARQKWNKLAAELQALTDPAVAGVDVATGVRDAQQVNDTQIRIRGEAEQLGPSVPRGFLSVVQFDGQPTVPTNHSGRLELAHWLADARNPLTARVMVNRVWKHVFGTGLVQSVDNFGTMGDKPSHPELLDFLATRFVSEGWSVKKLVRTLVLSRAYGLSSETTPENLSADPANRFVWRHNPRRLQAEELRDTALALAHRLERRPGEASPAKDLRVIELRNNGPEARTLTTSADQSRHRSVYLPMLRGIVPRPLEVFDFAEQGMVTGKRDTTTVATQALYLLNDPFVRRQALAWAEQLLGETAGSDAERLGRAYRAALGREATSGEIERAMAYLTEYEVGAQTQLAAAEAAKPAEPAPAASTGDANDAGVTNAAEAKKKQPVNPDEVDQTDEPLAEELITAPNARVAAWASYCQALLGSAEFFYLR